MTLPTDDNIRTIQANGVELRTQSFGDPRHPPVLLIMGATSSMIRWPEEICRRIAAAGRFVLRYDNRDTGRSTVFPVGRPGYDVRHLAQDAVAILDAYGIPKAHAVGMSLGGMIVQHLALFHADRVTSAILGVTTPDPSAIGLAASGHGTDRQQLPPPAPVTMTLIEFLAKVNWSDERQAIDAWVHEDLTLLGPGDRPDPEASRALLTRVVREARDIRAHRFNHGVAVASTPSWRHRLGDIRARSLVIHGTHDYCFPPEHGRALAREISGARLLEIEGMGHIIAPGSKYWTLLADTIIGHTSHDAGAMTLEPGR